MAKKKAVMASEVRAIKLEVLRTYLSHHEMKLEQFRIDLDKAGLFRDKSDWPGFARRLKEIVSELYTAGPRTTLIKEELAAARAELNASPEWVAAAAGMTEHDPRPFDYLLGLCYVKTMNDLNSFMNQEESQDSTEALAQGLHRTLEAFWVLLDAAFEPERRLRDKWLDALGGEKPGPSKKAGRPRDPDIERRNKKIVEAWATRTYKKFKDLANNFNVSEEVVRKVIGSVKKRKMHDNE